MAGFFSQMQAGNNKGWELSRNLKIKSNQEIGDATNLVSSGDTWILFKEYHIFWLIVLFWQSMTR